jgi:hypothetical protein
MLLWIEFLKDDLIGPLIYKVTRVLFDTIFKKTYK